MKDKEWIIKDYDNKTVSELSKKINVSAVLAKLLINRNYVTPQDALTFLKKDLTTFHSPFLMKDMEAGATVLLNAIKSNKRILIWGDYDVDGVTSVTILIKYIRSIGGLCEYYIPKRDDDGYGLNQRVIDEYIKSGVKLLITVDSGITAVEEIKKAKESGLEVIVTDHHECREILPNADAVINPKRADCGYPFKELAGVGVVFKFICAVEMLYTNRSHIEASSKIINLYSEFIAIGTIADVMPIADENRIIVSKGLIAIEKTNNIGLVALEEEAGITTSNPKKKKISSATIGFILAPRINAAGRMETSSIAVELFMTESREEAARLAVKLNEINKERQQLENESLLSALEKITSQCNPETDKILVLEDDSWHHGIIGIVASRITERYNLPSVLISFKNEIAGSSPDIGKGSARSIKGMNLVQALSSCSDLLQKFGGHELAAGLSIKRSDLQDFRKRINEYATKSFENISLTKSLNIDCELLPEDVNLTLANEMSRLEPFGLSNPVPLFSMQDVKILSVVSIGEGKHSKLLLEKHGYTHTALMFGTPVSALGFVEGDFVDVAFNIDVNNFKNQQTVQMIIRDIRPAKIERDIIAQHIYTYKKMLFDNTAFVRPQDIPTRTDFAHIYTLLRDTMANVGENQESIELYVPYLVKLASKKHCVSIPIFKALIILDVLSETHLIEMTDSCDTVFKTLICKQKPQPQGKIILENAPTIKKLFLKINN